MKIVEMMLILPGLGKRNFKPYLEEFMDSIFYALDGENQLANAAAERVLIFLR